MLQFYLLNVITLSSGVLKLSNITEKKRVLEVKWAGCKQEELAPTAGLGEKPAAKWDNGSWEMEQTDLMPCLEQQASFLIPSGG